MHSLRNHHALQCTGPTHTRSQQLRAFGCPRSKVTARASFLESLTTLFGGAGIKSAPKPRRPELVDQILDLVSESNQSQAVLKAQVVTLVKELQEQQQGVVTTDAEALSATWKLLWTTEKETEFIVKNAGVFGTKAGDVYQVIDVEEGRLQNVITFPPEGAFVVDSGIQVTGDQRVEFKFKSAELQLPGGKKLGLPPFGQGWFDTVYVDEEVRIARDIREDVLVVTRDGAPRWF